MPVVALGHIRSAPALLGTPLLSRLLSKVLAPHCRQPGNHPYPPAQHPSTAVAAKKITSRAAMIILLAVMFRVGLPHAVSDFGLFVCLKLCFCNYLLVDLVPCDCKTCFYSNLWFST